MSLGPVEAAKLSQGSAQGFLPWGIVYNSRTAAEVQASARPSTAGGGEPRPRTNICPRGSPGAPEEDQGTPDLAALRGLWWCQVPPCFSSRQLCWFELSAAGAQPAAVARGDMWPVAMRVPDVTPCHPRCSCSHPPAFGRCLVAAVPPPSVEACPGSRKMLCSGKILKENVDIW